MLTQRGVAVPKASITARQVLYLYRLKKLGGDFCIYSTKQIMPPICSLKKRSGGGGVGRSVGNYLGSLAKMVSGSTKENIL